MNITQRKQYCLQIMGITTWQMRQAVERVGAKYPYLLIIGETLNSEGQQLVSRMLQALSWPSEETRIEKLEDIHQVTAFFYQRIREIQPEKILLYGHALSQKLVSLPANPHVLSIDDRRISMGVLPTIQELLRDVSAKKRAWQVMQELGKI